MRTSRVTIGAAGALSLALLVGACSSASSPGLSSLTSEVPSTTEASTTTIVSATTIASTTTTVAPTTTVVATTTTVPAGAGLVLRGDGIGDALFGAEPEGVIDYINGVLGAPTSDSGWVSAPQRSCPGAEVRSVSWGDLALFFGDDSSVSHGRRHLFNWVYGPSPSGTAINPSGPATAAPARISVGATVAQLRAAYPLASVTPGDDIVGPSATISDGLFAFLTNPTSTGVVISLVGGFGCGE